MDGCALNLSVSALACAIAKGKSSDEIALLAVVFTQISDSLATIAAADEICENNGKEINIA